MSLACSLLTILFLIDGYFHDSIWLLFVTADQNIDLNTGLSKMVLDRTNVSFLSIEMASSYNAQFLLNVFHGKNKCAIFADEVFEPTFMLMRAQIPHKLFRMSVRYLSTYYLDPLHFHFSLEPMHCSPVIPQNFKSSPSITLAMTNKDSLRSRAATDEVSPIDVHLDS